MQNYEKSRAKTKQIHLFFFRDGVISRSYERKITKNRIKTNTQDILQ